MTLREITSPQENYIVSTLDGKNGLTYDQLFSCAYYYAFRYGWATTLLDSEEILEVIDIDPTDLTISKDLKKEGIVITLLNEAPEFATMFHLSLIVQLKKDLYRPLRLSELTFDNTYRELESQEKYSAVYKAISNKFKKFLSTQVPQYMANELALQLVEIIAELYENNKTTEVAAFLDSSNSMLHSLYSNLLDVLLSEEHYQFKNTIIRLIYEEISVRFKHTDV